MSLENFILDYNREADRLYVHLRPDPGSNNVDVSFGVQARVVPGTNEIVGLEILNPSGLFGSSDPAKIDRNEILFLLIKSCEQIRILASR